ncbi:MAG: sigma-E factor negative regulatory protein [Neisseriaceae bacterium]|nr:sigma-E factor negative regulatory protein [Neisseriaceae bacterium]
MDKRNEQISALMDDELNVDEQREVIDFLTQDKNARRVWAEYHIIRDCLQHSAEVAPRPASKIRQWLKLPTINDERWSAGVAASIAVVAFLGVMLWNKGSQQNVDMIETAPVLIQQNDTPTTDIALAEPSATEITPNADSSEYYLHTHSHSIDQDGLKQVSYSFE